MAINGAHTNGFDFAEPVGAIPVLCVGISFFGIHIEFCLVRELFLQCAHKQCANAPALVCFVDKKCEYRGIRVGKLYTDLTLRLYPLNQFGHFHTTQ